jgi:ribonuclease D
MKFNTSITKEEVAQLPLEEFKERIIVIQTEEDAEKAVNYLSDFDVVGFDTETRPNFRKGSSNQVALMQISTYEVCFLFRLNTIGIPDSLKNFLLNPAVQKIGLSLRDDFSAIRKRCEIDPIGFIDLQNYVVNFGITDASLQKIYAILFGKKISKGQRLTNWEAEELTEYQKRYASLDAWACLLIYEALYKEATSPATFPFSESKIIE